MSNIVIVIMLGVVLLVSSFGCGPKRVTVPEGTPVFDQPDVKNSNAPLVTAQPFDVEVTGTYIQFWQKATDYWFPVLSYLEFRQATFPDGRTLWFCEDLRFIDGSIQLIGDSKRSPYDVVGGVFLILCLATIYCWHKRHGKTTTDGGTSKYLPPLTLLILVFLRCAMLSFSLYHAGNTLAAPTDENAYFTITQDLLNKHTFLVESPWRMTIGMGIFYIPFALAREATCYYDLMWDALIVNGYVLMSASLALGFLILARLSSSIVKPFIGCLIWTVAQFFHFPYENFHSMTFSSMFRLPHFENMSMDPCYIYNYCGFNGMSDVPSMTLVLLTIYLALTKTVTHRWIITISALFGAACLVRISNVFFAPLLAYLFWRGLKEENPSLKTCLARAALAVVTFVVVFSPQFIINQIYFGSILTFPYVLHGSNPNATSAEGFVFSHLSFGIPYLINCNRVFMIMAAVGFLLMKSGLKRRALVLWTLPVIFFYSGYICLAASPIRFILTTYLPLCCSLPLLDAWNRNRTSGNIIAAAILVGNVLLYPALERYGLRWFAYLLGLTGWTIPVYLAALAAVPTFCVIASVTMFRNNFNTLVILLAFLLLLYANSPHLIYFVLIFCLSREAVTWAWEIISLFWNERPQTNHAAT